jgi:diguanylate cyclase (GGDEF)-like protein/PAS domain S-box-containing protein
VRTAAFAAPRDGPRSYRGQVTLSWDRRSGAGPSADRALGGPAPFLSFRWDVPRGSLIVRSMPVDRAAPSDRGDESLLDLLSPEDAESLRLRARAAHATGQPLDAQVWVRAPGRPPRLFWWHGERRPSDDLTAPIVGGAVDITDVVAGAAVSSAHGAADPGRFSWDGETKQTHLTDDGARLLGLPAAGAYPEDEVLAVFEPEDAARYDELLRAAPVGEPFDCDVRVVSSGDRVRLRTVVSSSTTGGFVITGTIEDLADRTTHQSLVNVSRALNTLSHGTHVLNTALDEHDLLDRVCATVVHDGGYLFAWYGRKLDDEERSVKPVAWAGYEAGYLSTQRFHWDPDRPTGRGPTGQALRTGKVRISHLVAVDTAFEPWRRAALDRGYVSSICLPVLVDGEVHGGLMVYASEPTAFDPTEIRLLADLAADIGYGLRRLQDLRALRETSRAHADSTARLQATLDSMLDPLVVLQAVRDEDGTLVDLEYVEANDAAVAYNRTTREELLGRRVRELFPGHVDEGLLPLYFGVVESGEPAVLDDLPYRNERRGETTRTDIRAVRCGDGIALTWRDTSERWQAQERIKEAERRFRMLAENSSDVVLLCDRAGQIGWVSSSVERATSWAPHELVGRTLQEFAHPDDAAPLQDALTRQHGPVSLSFRVRCADGSYRWMSAAGRWASDADRTEGLVLGLRDVHEQTIAEQALAERESRYRLLSENASDVVLQIDDDGRIAWASESVTSVLGWPVAELVGRVVLELVASESYDYAVAKLAGVTDDDHAPGQLLVQRSDGSTRWMSVASHRVVTEGARHRVLTLRDVTDFVQARLELEHAIGHDPLTGLGTRRTVLARLTRTLEETQDPRASTGVLCLGIDGLRDVNDALGHAAGDVVITRVAARIAESVGDQDLVGRGGGDEFLVIVPGLADAADASVVADRLLVAAQGEVAVGPHLVLPTVSIGIATGGVRSHPDDLLRDAGIALAQAKSEGRNRHAFADVVVAKEAQRRLDVDGAIRGGLRDREFVPWFQPIVLLPEGTLTGYEALVRWVRRDGSAVEPAAFLPVAERSSLITELDLAVLERSLEVLRGLPDELTVAVNVAAQSLSSAAYVERAVALIEGADVPTHRLHLEVTETAVLRINDQVRQAMDRIAGTGARWFMDDFGTGYSSISHLRDLPISGMKLDRSFTSALGAGDETSARLAQALAGLAHGLGLDTVAEGVETAEEAADLARYGWVHGQGWLFGRPAPLA